MIFAPCCPALLGKCSKDKWISLGIGQNKGFEELTMGAAENVTDFFLTNF